MAEPVIEGIYDSISTRAAPMVMDDKGTVVCGGDICQRLVSDEQVYNVAIQTFEGEESVDTDKWAPLSVKLEDRVVKVRVNKDELAKRLGLASKEELPEENLEHFVQDKITNQLRHKEEANLTIFENIRPQLVKNYNLDIKSYEDKGVKFKVDLPELLDKKNVDYFLNALRAAKEEVVEGEVEEVLLHAERLKHKLFRRHPELDNPEYKMGVEVAALTLAYKTLEASIYNNRSIGVMLKLPMSTVNNLEEEFLKGIDWNANVIHPKQGEPEIYIEEEKERSSTESIVKQFFHWWR